MEKLQHVDSRMDADVDPDRPPCIAFDANPKLILIGAAAQFGIFGAYMIALALGFEPNQAAGIAIIGEGGSLI